MQTTRLIGGDVVKNLETNLSSHMTNSAEDKKDTEPQSLSAAITNIPDIKDEKRDIILSTFNIVLDAERRLKALEKVPQENKKSRFTFFETLTRRKTSHRKHVNAITTARRNIIHIILSKILGITNQEEYQYFARLGHTELLAECARMIQKHKETNPIDIPALRKEFKNNLIGIAPGKFNATTDCTITLVVGTGILEIKASERTTVKNNATNHLTLTGSMESIKKTLASLTLKGTDEILSVYTNINQFNVFDLMSVASEQNPLHEQPFSLQLRQLIEATEKNIATIQAKKTVSTNPSDLFELEKQEIEQVEAIREWIIALVPEIPLTDAHDDTWGRLKQHLQKVILKYETIERDHKTTPGEEEPAKPRKVSIISSEMDVSIKPLVAEAKGSVPDAPPVKTEAPKTTFWQDFVNIFNQLGIAIATLISHLINSIKQCVTREESPRPAL